MDQQAVNLLNTLKRPAINSETKLNLLNALKSDIKHYRVPETAQATLFECIKLAITQQASSTLASSAFSTLGHLVKRLKIQDASGSSITQLAPRLLPALYDRLGDLREPVRISVAQALADLYPFCAGDIESLIRDEALTSSNARGKEAAMRWVLKMHQEQAMPFKSYVAPIVARLEDADGGVREAGKTVLVELFINAPERAKIDLRKQLKAHAVRHSIESQILAQIGTQAAPKSQTGSMILPEAEPELTGSTRSMPAADHSSRSANADAAQPPPQETVPMDPVYAQNSRELEDMFRDMLPHFDGKESEHNWIPRDKSILKVRRLLKGNAPTDFHNVFMIGIKSIIEGILKVANSLRTTLATNGCQLVQELSRTLGPALDPSVEILLQNFIKMTANTKHIASENGKQTTDAIFQHCSYHVRMMQHIWLAAQEKNASVRQCAPDWLKTILRRQAAYKQHFENSGGLDLAEKCIKQGLEDANPKVKEAMRAAYWTMARTWGDRADLLMSKLDPKTKTALERDANNPNSFLHAPQAAIKPTARPAAGANRSTLREVMAEQRKAAKAAGTVMERPNSAMATISPAKSRSTTNLNAAARAGTSGLSQTQRADARTASTTDQSSASSAAKKGNSLMSGPVRRPRRPEVPRPQTADPYASRRMLRPETPADASPLGSPHRGTDASKASIAVSGSSRSRAAAGIRVAGSPIGSPARHSPLPGFMHAHNNHMLDSRPTSKGSVGTNHGDASAFQDDDTPMAISSARGATDRGEFSPGHKRSGLGQTRSVDSGIHALEEDDGFTMVIPSFLNQQQRARSPLAYRSPVKAMIDDARERVGNLSPEAQRQVDEGGPHPTHSRPSSTHHRPSPQPANPDDMQIYEDPFTDDPTDPHTQEEDRQVLGELPVNENIRLASPTQSIASSASPGSPRPFPDLRSPAAPTPQDAAEVLRNKRLLASGIDRIRAKTLDAHGFRRVQDLARSRLDIWDGGSRYDELMAVLLEYLLTFDSDPKLALQPSSKTSGLKAQALGLVRALLTLHRKRAAAWHPKALVAVLACRPGIDANSHLLTDLDRTALEIIGAAQPASCIDAVIAFLPSSASDDIDINATVSAPGPRGTAMALTALRQLVSSARARRPPPSASSSSPSTPLPAPLRSSLTDTAARFLSDPDAEVRKADVDLAIELFDLFVPVDSASDSPEQKRAFWAHFAGVEEGRLGLLTYYLAKRGARSPG